MSTEQARSLDNGAWIARSATVAPSAHVGARARVGAGARVGDGAVIGDGAVMGDRVVMGDGAWIGDGAVIGDDAVMGARAVMGDGAVMGDRAVMRTTRDALLVGPVGSRNAYLTAYRMGDGTVHLATGCFSGTLAELLAACDTRHGPDHEHTRDYRLLAPWAHDTLAARLATEASTEASHD